MAKQAPSRTSRSRSAPARSTPARSAPTRSSPQVSVARAVSHVVPQKRSLILLETALLAGLFEGIMWNLVTGLHTVVYIKALVLMAGVVGMFALAVQVLEPVIQFVLKFIAKLEAGGGVLARLGLHLLLLFLIYVGYVRIFFKAG